MARIGVFVCQCGNNIAAEVRTAEVAEKLKDVPGVVHAEDARFYCSNPGQEQIRKMIKEHNLDGLIVSACSPHMHEKTFRKAAETAGLNPFRVEIANIREHCSLGPPRPDEGPGDGEGGRHCPDDGRARQARPAPLQDQDPCDEAGAGDRRRRCGNPGGARHRRRRAGSGPRGSVSPRSAATWPSSPRRSPRWTARSAS